MTDRAIGKMMNHLSNLPIRELINDHCGWPRFIPSAYSGATDDYDPIGSMGSLRNLKAKQGDDPVRPSEIRSLGKWLECRIYCIEH